MKCLLRRMLDETEFLSPHGVRSLSRAHLDVPYVYNFNGQNLQVSYDPGESRTDVFGGNSNWRGPIWLPCNFMIIESLRRFHRYYGDDFKIECPTRSGQQMTIRQAADELERRVASLFLRDAQGRRPVFNGYPKFQNDPHFRDHILFHEFFHGDNGSGLGASHQTGWTGLVARMLSGTGASK
jgi:hypothetical protein